MRFSRAMRQNLKRTPSVITWHSQPVFQIWFRKIMKTHFVPWNHDPNVSKTRTIRTIRTWSHIYIIYIYIYIYISYIEYIYISRRSSQIFPTPKNCSGGGLGLRATKDVEPNEVALAIPLDLVLTVPVAARSIAGASRDCSSVYVC